MDKRKKPNANAKTATAKKAKGANTPATHGKPTGRKAQAAQADNAGLPELLRELIAGVSVVADRVESVRRTLWRMSEVRNYTNKGDKGNGEADAESRKQKMIQCLGELYYPQWESLVQDIASGRIDTAPEYAAFRAEPHWAAFRASFNMDGAKPEAKKEGGAK